MFNDCRRSHDLACFGVEDGQARGHSAADKEPVVRVVERHGKFVVQLTGQRASTVPFTKSATSTSCLSGTFTKTRVPIFSS